MRPSGWFCVVAGAVVAVEFLLTPIFGDRPVGALVSQRVPFVAGLHRSEVSIGTLVADADAARIRGAATMEPECSGWDADSGGCDAAYTVDDCPENFDIMDSDGCFFCEYTNHKSTGTRECTGGNETYREAGSCYEGVIDSLTGCVVR